MTALVAEAGLRALEQRARDAYRVLRCPGEARPQHFDFRWIGGSHARYGESIVGGTNHAALDAGFCCLDLAVLLFVDLTQAKPQSPQAVNAMVLALIYRVASVFFFAFFLRSEATD